MAVQCFCQSRQAMNILQRIMNERELYAGDRLKLLAVACLSSIHWFGFLLLCNSRLALPHLNSIIRNVYIFRTHVVFCVLFHSYIILNSAGQFALPMFIACFMGRVKQTINAYHKIPIRQN